MERDEVFEKILEVSTEITCVILCRQRRSIMSAIRKKKDAGEEGEMTCHDVRRSIFAGMVMYVARHVCFLLTGKEDPVGDFTLPHGKAGVTDRVDDWIDESFSDEIIDRWVDGFRSSLPERMLRDTKNIRRIVSDVLVSLLSREEMIQFFEEYTTARRTFIAAHIAHIVSVN